MEYKIKIEQMIAEYNKDKFKLYFPVPISTFKKSINKAIDKIVKSL